MSSNPGLGCAEKVICSSSVEETSNITKTDEIDRIKQYGIFSNIDNGIGTNYLHGMNKEFIAKFQEDYNKSLKKVRRQNSRNITVIQTKIMMLI